MDKVKKIAHRAPPEENRRLWLDGKQILRYNKGVPTAQAADGKEECTVSEEELDYTPDLITLEDEDGKEHEFEVIDAVDHNDEHYMALLPYSSDPAKALEENADLLIMRVGVDENNEEFLTIVDEDEELYEVSQVFAKRLEEYFKIES